jgi:hypothetical protein
MDKRLKVEMQKAKEDFSETARNLIAGADSNFGSTGEIFLINPHHQLKSSKCDSL